MGRTAMSASRLRRRARSRPFWIRSHDKRIVCARAREKRGMRRKRGSALLRSRPLLTVKPPPKTALQHRVHGAWPQSARRSGVSHCRFFA